MAKVIFILGLCGAGKSHLAETLKAKNPDLHILDEGLNPHPPFNKLFHQNYDELLTQLQKGKDCVVIEILYCSNDARDFIVAKLEHDVPDVIIEWMCIENNLVKANKNVLMRALQGIKPDIDHHLRINAEVSPHYTYPKGVKPLPIHELKNLLQ